jgi:hypothetical protein
VFYFEIDIALSREPLYYSEDSVRLARFIALIVMNISSVLFCIILVLRYIEDHRLKRVLKVVKQNDHICNTYSAPILISEILFALFQPYPFLEGYKILTDKHFYLRTVEYEINTLLLLPVLARAYTVYSFLISMTWFYNAKADRVSKMFGGRISRLFAVKCLLFEYPLMTILMFQISSSILLAYFIRIVEYSDEFTNNTETQMTEFKYLGDALYFVYITYCTIGYGDYFPKTNLGRVFGIITALIGTYLTSITIICLQNRFDLSPIENQVIVFI